MATTHAEGPRAIGFAEYMARCLHDPSRGYYGGGRVSFGREADFWTWPEELSPAFGAMVAELARRLVGRLGSRASGPTPTILELGAGDGGLARDVLDHAVARRDDSAWAELPARLRYLVGERSPALRSRQEARLAEHVEAGRAEVRPLDASRDRLAEPPFRGLVVANELVDTFPLERIRFRGSPPRPFRVELVAEDARGRRMPWEGFWRRVAPGSVPDDATVRELETPLETAWPDGPPAELAGHLAFVAPLVDDLDALGRLPTEVLWPVGLPGLLDRIAELLTAPGSAGAALLVDYGGTSRHVLDPAAVAPHLRVYGPDHRLAHTEAVYEAPGRDDVTHDVDFTALARLARARGLDVAFYGPQQALEQPPIHLDEGEAAEALRHVHGDDAPERVRRFRASAGFQAIVLTPHDGPALDPGLGPGEPVDGDGLATLRPDPSRRDLAEALLRAGLNPDLGNALKPGGDPASDAADRGAPGQGPALRALLDGHGWLARPGELATPGWPHARGPV